MHQHNCPLCDKDFQCDDFGCEELQSSVCKECYDAEKEEAAS